jgi:ubiquitin thioesterase protein OTUB1
MAFLYFEALYQLGDRKKIEAEIRRLTSLNALISQAGYDEMTFTDFVECTIDLLQKTIDAILNGSGDEFLAESFNDEGMSSAIIMHFRVS